MRCPIGRVLVSVSTFTYAEEGLRGVSRMKRLSSSTSPPFPLLILHLWLRSFGSGPRYPFTDSLPRPRNSGMYSWAMTDMTSGRLTNSFEILSWEYPPSASASMGISCSGSRAEGHCVA